MSSPWNWIESVVFEMLGGLEASLYQAVDRKTQQFLGHTRLRLMSRVSMTSNDTHIGVANESDYARKLRSLSCILFGYFLNNINCQDIAPRADWKSLFHDGCCFETLNFWIRFIFHDFRFYIVLRVVVRAFAQSWLVSPRILSAFSFALILGFSLFHLRRFLL